jgi:hypothetical protein
MDFISKTLLVAYHPFLQFSKVNSMLDARNKGISRAGKLI